MKTLADNVMLHLELLRERAERLRGTRMSNCLNAFINPEAATVGKGKRGTGSNGNIRKHRHSTSLAGIHSRTFQPSLEKEIEEGQLSESESSVADTMDTAKSSIGRVGEDDHLRIFRDAANLLRTSLDIESGGGG